MKMSKKMKQAITVAAIAGTMALAGTAFAGDAGWTTQTLGASKVTMNEMAVTAGGKAAVVGESGKIYYATVDGTTTQAQTWAEASVPVTTGINGVAVAGGSFVAVGDAGVVLRDGTTGNTWEKVAFTETGINLLDIVATSASNAIALGSDGKLYATTNLNAAAASAVTWTAYSLTTDMTATGTALDVASSAKGIVSETGGYVVFGGASKLAFVNTALTAAYNITGLADLAVDSTATTPVKFGSVEIAGITAAGANRYIFGAGGKLAYTTALTAATVSPVVANRGVVAVSGLTADIKSLSWTAAIHGFFTTSTGAVYTVGGADVNGVPVWSLASAASSSSLNTVITEAAANPKYRGFAAGDKGVMVWGKAIEWKEATQTVTAGTAADVIVNSVGTTDTIWYITNQATAASVQRTTDLTAGGTATNSGPAAMAAGNGAAVDAGDGMIFICDANAANLGDAAIIKADGTNKAITQLAGGGSGADNGKALYAGKDTANGDKTYLKTISANTAIALKYDVSGDTLAASVTNVANTGKVYTFQYNVNTAAEDIGFSASKAWAVDLTNNKIFNKDRTAFVDTAYVTGTAGGVTFVCDTSVLDVDGAAAGKIDNLVDAYIPGVASSNVYAILGDGGAAGAKLYTLTDSSSAITEDNLPTATATIPFTWVAGTDFFFGEGSNLFIVDVSADNVYKLVDTQFILQGAPKTDTADKTYSAGANYSTGGAVLAYTEDQLTYTTGADWKEKAFDLESSTNFNSIYNATAGFYAAGDNSMLYKSTDGKTWTEVTSIVETLAGNNINRIDGIGSALYVYDSANKMYKFDGSTWAQFPNTTTALAGIVDTVITAEDKGYALLAGSIVDFADLTTSKATISGTATAMAQIATDSYLVVGTSGKAWTFDGTTLTAVTSDTTNTKTLRAIFKLGEKVYVSGDSGYLATYAAGKLTQVTTGLTADLDMMWGYDNFLFMASAEGKTYKYDGKNFFNEQAASATLNDLTGSIKNGGLVAVGNSGKILLRELGNSGLVMLPGQKDNFTYTSRSVAATTPNTLNSTYGVDNSTLKLLGDQMSFTATIDAGKTATVGFSFQAAANASKTSDIGLIKLIGGAGTALKHFYFNQSAEITTDAGKYYITSTTPETDGTYKALAGDLTVGKDYYVWFNIKDDGNGDLNKTAGQITDPIVATTSGAASPATSSSSSSGCVFNPAAGFGLEWLMLMAAPMVAVIRNRFKK
ncbi:beta strand repeat-containing protein [Maridesulfovibrio sp.]|uniref:beta strand repeat-containing protein n=1 Tax=unclassified Maridesulfovibrio TaxID=2794999 RepID=UPI003B00FAEA